MNPGDMAFAVMPKGANIIVRIRVSIRIPVFAMKWAVITVVQGKKYGVIISPGDI